MLDPTHNKLYNKSLTKMKLHTFPAVQRTSSINRLWGQAAEQATLETETLQAREERIPIATASNIKLLLGGMLHKMVSLQ